MPDYSVVFSSSARKELEDLDAPVVETILPGIEDLGRNPRPRGSEVEGLSRALPRAAGDYRILYSIDDAKRLVDIAAVRHRRESISVVTPR